VNEFCRKAHEYLEVPHILDMISDNQNTGVLIPHMAECSTQSSWERGEATALATNYKMESKDSQIPIRLLAMIMMVRESNSQGTIDALKHLSLIIRKFSDWTYHGRYCFLELFEKLETIPIRKSIGAAAVSASYHFALECITSVPINRCESTPIFPVKNFLYSQDFATHRTMCGFYNMSAYKDSENKKKLPYAKGAVDKIVRYEADRLFCNRELLKGETIQGVGMHDLLHQEFNQEIQAALIDISNAKLRVKYSTASEELYIREIIEREDLPIEERERLLNQWEQELSQIESDMVKTFNSECVIDMITPRSTALPRTHEQTKPDDPWSQVLDKQKAVERTIPKTHTETTSKTIYSLRSLFKKEATTNRSVLEDIRKTAEQIAVVFKNYRLKDACQEACKILDSLTPIITMFVKPQPTSNRDIAVLPF